MKINKMYVSVLVLLYISLYIYVSVYFCQMCILCIFTLLGPIVMEDIMWHVFFLLLVHNKS